MTTINSNSVPNLNIPSQPQTGSASQTAFKGDADDNKVAEAIEQANKTSSTAAKAALITSCATLLPLSVLAYKTHNLSKVAEALQKDAKPTLEKIGKAAGKVETLADSAKPIVDDVHSITTTAKEGVANIGNTVEKFTKDINPKDLKTLLTEVQDKIAKIDTNVMNEAMISEATKAIEKLSDAASGKIKDIDPKVIEDAISKIQDIDVKGLSDSAIKLLEKLQNFRIMID